MIAGQPTAPSMPEPRRLRGCVRVVGAVLVLGLGSPTAAAPALAQKQEDKVDFARDIRPLLQQRCVECHGASKASGGLRLDAVGLFLEGGITGKALVPGDARKSYLMVRLRGEGGEDQMPLKAAPLSPDELALVARWIDQGAVVPAEPPARFTPAPAGIKRLTVPQYRNSLRALLGDDVELPADLEPDTLVSGSAAVGAARIPLSARATEQFQAAAARLGRWAASDPGFRAQWLTCASEPMQTAAAQTCLRDFVTRFGRRAWRRPMTADEITRYAALGLRVRGGFWKRVEVVTAGLLQSPHFLYRVEVGRPDPTDPTRRVLTDFELAARLSFFLWGAPPDDALLDAAAAGRLATEGGLREQADRMLASPRSRQVILAFFTELLRLKRLDRLPQFRTAFVQATPTLGPAMRAETLKVIEEIAFDGDRDFREIFDTRVTYVNDELARLYGVAAPPTERAGRADEASSSRRDQRSGNAPSLVRIQLPADGTRAGILTHGSFLALNAHPTASSPTRRGKFIREVLLCQAVPPPPPNVSTRLPEDHGDGPPKTTRQKLDVHRQAPQCAGCHKAMDPMGLAFETFDGLGVFRDKEAGLPIDASGELDGVPFKNAAELGALLRHSPKVGACMARNLFRFALGHLESDGEEPLMAELAQGLEQDGYRFRSLVLNVVKSRGFRYVAAPGHTPSHDARQRKEPIP